MAIVRHGDQRSGSRGGHSPNTDCFWTSISSHMNTCLGLCFVFVNSQENDMNRTKSYFRTRVNVDCENLSSLQAEQKDGGRPAARGGPGPRGELRRRTRRAPSARLLQQSTP